MGDNVFVHHFILHATLPEISSRMNDYLTPFLATAFLGGALFGAVIGWMAHRAYFETRIVTVTWISSLLGVICGGTITALFNNGASFDAYCIGLGSSFFLRMILFSPFVVRISERIRRWLFKGIPGHPSERKQTGSR